jgi:lysophospholipase L1-like esterase
LSVACSAPTATSTPETSGPAPQGTVAPSPRGNGQPAIGSATSSPSGAPSAIQPSTRGQTLRYVAIGDSYTIGQGVRPRERWPNQLARSLGPGWGLELVANLGVTGATTQDVLSQQLAEMAAYQPGFVSLLIGVNDVVQGVPIDTYRRNLRTIVRHILGVVPRNRLLMVTIPDYTLAPAGPSYGGRGMTVQVAAFNEAMRTEADADGVTCVDITPVADRVSSDESLVADDGLHPSAKQYAAWVELIVPNVRRLLSEPPDTGPAH